MTKTRRRFAFLFFSLVAATLLGGVLAFKAWNAGYAEMLDVGSDIDSALSSYSKDFKSKSLPLLKSFYREDASGTFLSHPSAAEETSGVKKISYLRAPDGAPGQLNEQVERYFDQVEAIDNAKFKLNRLYDYSPGKSADVRLRFQVWGKLKSGDGFYDYGLLATRLGKDSEGNWEITSQDVEEAYRILRPEKKFFTDATKESGLEFSFGSIQETNELVKDYKFSIINRLSRGSGVADVDSDGDSDLFITGVRRAGLFINDGRGQFTDATAKWGLDEEGTSYSSFPLFADIDNDGDPDLLLLRSFSESKVFRNDNGRFTDATAESELKISPYAMTASFGDYDADGYLDLFVGSYGDTKNDVPETVVRSRNGQRAQLFRNRGDWTFEDVTVKAGIDHTGWALACSFFDLNGDNAPDIYIANDFGYNCVYKNNRDGTFTDGTWEFGTHDIGSSMNISLLDYNGDGKLDLYTSGIASNTVWFQGPGMTNILGRFITNPSTFAQTFRTFVDLGIHVDLNELDQIGYKVNGGNSLIENQGNGHFRHVKQDLGSAWAEWSWGAAAGDFDNDCDTDLYVANGFITAPDTKDF
ncbi:MAG TPA: VCBS repeat-containing protein [Blastocatellia bacterium]|jgi:hypothetical protein|nr:VCBS repeat-containing protein [Blastocatellia bacterium]